jgi:spore coat protein A, manganese oxidase
MRTLRPVARRTFLKLSAATGVALAIAPRVLMSRVAASDGAVSLDPLSQPRFVNPLPNPLDPSFVFQPTTPGGSHYEIGVHQFEQTLGLRDPATGAPLLTTVWGYGNAAQPPTYPGRTFVVRRDQQITVHWTNDLTAGGTPLPHLLPIDTTVHWALMDATSPYPASGVPVVTHLHGGHNRSDSDGLPDAWFTPGFAQTGRLFNETYNYENDQEAATLWYHDHALGITRLNVYAGLAGFFILRDANEDALVAAGYLPAGPYEIPIVIQDRMFDQLGQLLYPYEREEAHEPPEASVLPEFFGDIILVNGQAWPYLEVEPRQYRVRLLNGSDSRFYDLFLSSGQPFHQIGTDDGLLETPVTMDRLTTGPGERHDVVVDFSAPALWGSTIILRNNARAPFPKGEAVNPRTAGQIMAFKVTKPLDTSSYPLTTLPADLRPILGPIVPLPAPVTTRQLLLFEGEDEFGRILPLLGTTEHGGLDWDDPITENPMLHDTEVWEIHNATEDAHPIHLHEVAFRVLDRQKFRADKADNGALSNIRYLGRPKPPAPNEVGWKDTVQMFPGEVTRIVASFDLPGEYVWHCHILSHEDHEMMRPYFIGPMP